MITYQQKEISLNTRYNLILNTLILPKCKRTMNFYVHEFHSRKYIELPNLYFILITIFDKINKKYIYGGSSANALYVFYSNKPIDLNNVDYDNLYYLNDYMNYSVCTDHDYDYKRFDSVDEMIKFVLNQFLSLPLYIKEIKSNIKAKNSIESILSNNGFYNNDTKKINQLNNYSRYIEFGI